MYVDTIQSLTIPHIMQKRVNSECIVYVNVKSIAINHLEENIQKYLHDLEIAKYPLNRTQKTVITMKKNNLHILNFGNSTCEKTRHRLGDLWI